MKKFAIGILLSTLLGCSMGGKEGRIDAASNASRTPSSENIPTVSLDRRVLTLSQTAPSTIVTGDCMTGPFKNYAFVVNFLERSASSSTLKTYSSKCVNGRFSLTIPYIDVQLRPGTNGTLTVNITAFRTEDEVDGPVDTAVVGWQAAPPPPPSPTPTPTGPAMCPTYCMHDCASCSSPYGSNPNAHCDAYAGGCLSYWSSCTNYRACDQYQCGSHVCP